MPMERFSIPMKKSVNILLLNSINSIKSHVIYSTINLKIHNLKIFTNSGIFKIVQLQLSQFFAHCPPPPIPHPCSQGPVGLRNSATIPAAAQPLSKERWEGGSHCSICEKQGPVHVPGTHVFHGKIPK